MKRNIATAFFFIIAIFLIQLLSYSCNIKMTESESEKAMRLENQRKILKERQDRLAANVDKRIAEGESSPPKVNDLGFPIVYCINPKPSNNIFVVNSGMKGGEDWYICENAQPVQAILEYRKWYCKGEEKSCVVGQWKENKPTFNMPGFPVGIRLQMGKTLIELEDSRIIWP